MRKVINLILFQIILLAFFACAKTPVYQSAYQSSEFKLSELNKDWEGNTYTSLEQGMVYGLTNDENNLYVRLKIVSERNQRKILMNGLVLWFDTEGKSKKNIGFAFPLINEKARDEYDLTKRSADDEELRRKLQSLQIESGKVNQRFVSESEAINVISKSGGVKETISTHRNSEGLNMMMYMDEYHVLYYEARIPLSKIFENYSTTAINEIPEFSYGFEIGELMSSIRAQSYFHSPISKRNLGMGGGMYGNRSIGVDTQPSRVMRTFAIRNAEIWVKKAKLGVK